MTTALTPLPTPTAEDLVALQKYDSSVRVRALVERAIARKAIEVLTAAGYTITVDDGDDEPVKRSVVPNDIMEAVFAVDEATLYVHDKPEGKAFAWISFIMGNTGWDVVNDHTVNLEEVLKPVSNYADQMSEWF